MREGQRHRLGSPDEMRGDGHDDLEDAFIALAGDAMSAPDVLATALRVLAQLRHDRRTLALVLVVPPALLTLLVCVRRVDRHVRPHRRRRSSGYSR